MYGAEPVAFGKYSSSSANTCTVSSNYYYRNIWKYIVFEISKQESHITTPNRIIYGDMCVCIWIKMLLNTVSSYITNYEHDLNYDFG